MSISTILEAIGAEIETARTHERLRDDQIDRIERLLRDIGEFTGLPGEMQRLLRNALSVHRARNGRNNEAGISLAYDHVVTAWSMLYPELMATGERAGV
jgi:hypothetical protein